MFGCCRAGGQGAVVAEIFAGAMHVVQPFAAGLHRSWWGPRTFLHSSTGWIIERGPHRARRPRACERISVNPVSRPVQLETLIMSPGTFPVGGSPGIVCTFELTRPSGGLHGTIRAAVAVLVGSRHPKAVAALVPLASEFELGPQSVDRLVTIRGAIDMEVLIYPVDAGAVQEAVTAAGGRLVHALTAHLLVISVPDTVSISSIPGASEADPARLEGTERELAQAWLSKFGTTSRAVDRLAKPEEQPIPWDTPGYLPPNYLPGRAPTRSTNTPTSVVLTGSVAVGIVMVSGPPDSPPWTSVHGALKYVSVGMDGTVWGVNADDKIYRFNAGNGNWDAIPGALKQISVGSAGNVWGVNADDKIYRRNGNSWTQVSGALKHVSVAADGTVWGVNADDKIYRRDGNAWTQINGRLKQIDVGNAGAIWGVNADDKIYRWNGNSWTQVSGALKHVSVAADGTVWGVNADDNIYRRSRQILPCSVARQAYSRIAKSSGARANPITTLG